AFALFAHLSGLVPLVGIASGYCFAGNAALLGCCDVVIATEDSSIGMGGPAMIEGGGLGVFEPGEVGPIEVQDANGVVDLRALGIVANDSTHLGGAIDAPAADKAARFMGLCDAFELPLLFLCDTPGFMVGPAAERTASVRHFARMFLAGANLSVPAGTIVLRKGYGLGAQAMAGGGFKAPLFTVAWPTSE